MNDTEYLKSSKKTYRDIRHSLTSRKGITFRSIEKFNKHYNLNMEKITIKIEMGEQVTTVIKEGDFNNLSKILPALEDALRGAGFCFNGHLNIEE